MKKIKKIVCDFIETKVNGSFFKTYGLWLTTEHVVTYDNILCFLIGITSSFAF